MTACRSEVIVSNTVIFMSIQLTNLSIKSFIHDLSLSIPCLEAQVVFDLFEMQSVSQP